MTARANDIAKHIMILAIILIAAFACASIVGGHGVALAADEDSESSTGSDNAYSVVVTDYASGKTLSEGASDENAVTYNARSRDIRISVKQNGVDRDDYTVTYYRVNDGKKGLVSEPLAHAGDYEIVVKIDANEYAYSFKINRAPVTVDVSGGYEYTYSGAKYSRTVSLLGVITGDSCNVQTTYSYLDEEGERVDVEGSPSDVHEYTVEYAVDNSDYYITGCNGKSPDVFNITPKTLTVKVENISVKYGQEPEYKFAYSGFAQGEDKKVIKVLPKVKGASAEVGGYEVTPYGAEADNYVFEYVSGILTVDALEASGIVEGTASEITVKGEFTPNTAFSGSLIDVKSDEGKAVIKDVKANKAFPTASKAIAIYAIGVAEGKEVSELVNVTLTNVTLDAKKTYSIIAISSSGVIKTITKYTYANGVLSFNSYGTGTFLIVENQANLAIWIYCGVGVVVLLILLLLGAKAQYYNYKRSIARDKRRKQRKKYGEYTW